MVPQSLHSLLRDFFVLISDTLCRSGHKYIIIVFCSLSLIVPWCCQWSARNAVHGWLKRTEKTESVQSLVSDKRKPWYGCECIHSLSLYLSRKGKKECVLDGYCIWPFVIRAQKQVLLSRLSGVWLNANTRLSFNAIVVWADTFCICHFLFFFYIVVPIPFVPIQALLTYIYGQMLLKTTTYLGAMTHWTLGAEKDKIYLI